MDIISEMIRFCVTHTLSPSLDPLCLQNNDAVTFPHQVTIAPGPDVAGGRPGVQLKLGLTKTMINNARQLSRSLISKK